MQAVQEEDIQWEFEPSNNSLRLIPEPHTGSSSSWRRSALGCSPSTTHNKNRSYLPTGRRRVGSSWPLELHGAERLRGLKV